MSKGQKGLWKELEQKQRELDLLKRKMTATCTHKNKHGEPVLDIIGGEKGRELWQCAKCGAKFHLNRVRNKDMEFAMQILTDVTEQMRINSSDDEQDRNISMDLATLQYNAGETFKMYREITDESGKGRKNRNKRGKNRNKGSNSTFTFGAPTLGSGYNNGGGGKRNKGGNNESRGGYKRY